MGPVDELLEALRETEDLGLEEVLRCPAFCIVFWRVRSLSTLLTWSSPGSDASVARVGEEFACCKGDLRYEFLRMPVSRRISINPVSVGKHITFWSLWYLSAMHRGWRVLCHVAGRCVFAQESSWRIYDYTHTEL